MKKLIKQTVAMTLAVAIASSTIGTATTSFAEKAKETKKVRELKVDRLAGKNRYETSVRISKEYATVGGKVIVASGENYADALSGSPLSGEIDAPILLTSAKETPAAVKAEINRIHPAKTYVLGGSSSVSDTQLNTLPNSQRVAGKDRIETSIKVNELRKENVTLEKESIYNAHNYPDALAAGPLARTMKLELIPVQKANSPSYIFGGKSTVKYTGEVEKRFSGKDRYKTAVEIAKQFAEVNGGVKKVVIASGEDYPDALSSSIVSKVENAPILLVRSNTLPEEVREFIKDNKVEEAVIIGGTSSVSNGVAGELRAVYTPDVSEIKDAFNNDEFIGLKEIERELVKLVNKLRADNGVAPLEISEVNRKETMIRASEMAEYGDIRVNGVPHARPDGSSWVTAFKEGIANGENMLLFPVIYSRGKINIGFTEEGADASELAETCFEIWYNSPGHKENMLRSTFKTMSLGVQVNKSKSVIESDIPNLPHWFKVIGVQIFSSYTDEEILQIKGRENSSEEKTPVEETEKPEAENPETEKPEVENPIKDEDK